MPRATPNKTAVEVVVHEGLEALEPLRTEWHALVAACARPSPFLTYEWLATSWRHFAGGDRLLTLCFREGGSLVGVLPLRVTRSPLHRQLQFAVQQADCPDLLVEAGAEWRVLGVLVTWLRDEFAEWDVLRLRGVYSRSATNELLPVLAQQAGLAWFARPIEPCPYLPLPATPEVFYEQLPSRRRLREHRRRMRQLEREHGELVFRVTEPAEITPEHMRRFFELHRKSWEGRPAATVLDEERVLRFHSDLAAALAPTGVVRLLHLSIGERDVAAGYGFSMGGAFFDYMGGYDPGFSRYAVGRQADLSAMEYAIREGLVEFDLLKGGERYKFDYTRRCAYVMDHSLFRSPTKLKLFLTASALRGRLTQ